MNQHYKIKVTGKVQGVFFRACTLEKANELKLKGFVRNQPDGSVYIEAEGTNDQLTDFLMWCEQGSPQSHVDGVDCQSGDLKGFGEFTIDYS